MVKGDTAAKYEAGAMAVHGLCVPIYGGYHNKDTAAYITASTAAKGDTVIKAGALEIALGYQPLMADQGLSVQVYGQVDGRDTEVLRFDCFDQDPHYHYGPENENIRYHMDKATVGHPLGWTLGQIRSNLPAMIRRAGYKELAAAVEAAPISPAKLDEVEAKARELARTKHRASVHGRGDYVFEAGNIRFGLNVVEWKGDWGVAIHLLSDVVGQEIEVLSFHMFQESPHYEYGPRNQDVVIFLDPTTSGDFYRWTLDQFKARKLKAMIERAGYPTIAANLDEELIQSVLPAVEEKVFALAKKYQR